MCVVLQHDLGKGDAALSRCIPLAVAQSGIEPLCASETYRRFITRGETSLSPAPHRPKGEVTLPCGIPLTNPARIGCAFLLRGFTPRACKASPRIPKGTRVRSLLALATPILAG